ncbi:hypothetical protein Csa_007076 [Cucumis sativus]|uniref:Uncharacterized protein n=1 Tax=Cucumis sativus TaxID=3659 RepID=A0A0A0LZZ7_CUCSA|nr:hypothetical protein Csa_007076 [Cucumis sativus]
MDVSFEAMKGAGETAGDYNFYRFEELLGMVEKYEMKVHLSICAPPLVQALALLLFEEANRGSTSLVQGDFSH